MEPYKSIQSCNKINLQDFTTESVFKVTHSYFLDEYSEFGITKINDDFISTIFVNKSINVVVSEENIDDFLCFFVKNRIILTEKKRNQNYFTNLILKKYWTKIQLVTFDKVLEDERMDYVDPIEHVPTPLLYYVFQRVQANIVKMNNRTEIIIPLFERG